MTPRAAAVVPQVYGVAGCMSSSFWWNSEDFNGTIMVKDAAPTNLTVYLDSGGVPHASCVPHARRAPRALCVRDPNVRVQTAAQIMTTKWCARCACLLIVPSALHHSAVACFMLCVLPHRTLLHVACVIFGGCLRAQQTQTVRDRMETLGFTLQDNLFYYLDHGGQQRVVLG